MSLPWKTNTPRCVFITGGGSGIGREMARRLAAEGASVAIFNRRLAPDVVNEMQAVAPHPSQRLCSYAADVTDAAALTAAVERAVAELGPPDLAINSAGIQIAKPFELLGADEFDRVVAVNLGGSRNFAAALWPHLRPDDHLVFVASLAAMVGNFSYAAYCASKFGVRGLVESLRIELALRGVAVSICCPGEVETPMVEGERIGQHPVSKALKGLAGCRTVEVSVDRLLRGIARRRFEITDGPLPWLTATSARHLPGLGRAFIDRVAARAMARASAK